MNGIRENGVREGKEMIEVVAGFQRLRSMQIPIVFGIVTFKEISVLTQAKGLSGWLFGRDIVDSYLLLAKTSVSPPPVSGYHPTGIYMILANS